MPRSKRDQLSPSASSFSRRSKLPSLPPRLSIEWTRVASRVAGTTGEPCSSCPWWERMMWRMAWARSRVEALDPLDLAADLVVAARDLALEPAGVGQLDRERIVVVGLGLADVVEHRAGDGDLAVDAGEEVGGRAHRLGDREGVLEQPAGVGLVVVLGGRRLAEAGPRSRSRGRRSGRAASRSERVLDRRRSARAGRPRAARPSAPGPPPAARRRTRRGPAGRTAASLICLPNCGWIAKLPVTSTIEPGAQTSKHSATPSQAIAGTVPVLSARTTRRKSSPLRFWRRSRSRTTKAPVDLVAVGELAKQASLARPRAAPLPLAVVEERLRHQVIEIRGGRGQDSPAR